MTLLCPNKFIADSLKNLLISKSLFTGGVIFLNFITHSAPQVFAKEEIVEFNH